MNARSLLAHLQGLTNLRGLDLGSTRVASAGLALLKTLAKLEVLDLTDTGDVRLRLPVD